MLIFHWTALYRDSWSWRYHARPEAFPVAELGTKAIGPRRHLNGRKGGYPIHRTQARL